MSSDKVNWKQARVDAAVAAMQGMMANREIIVAMLKCSNAKGLGYQLARSAVQYADSLIAELKKTNETK